MRLHYKGKFDGNEENLPKGELAKHQNAVKFKEIDDIKKLMIVMNIVAIIVMFILGAVYILRIGEGHNLA